MKLVKSKIKRANGTYRLMSVPKGASMTDQSDANYLNINNIMKNYSKTGILPQFQDKVAQYIDATQIPSYMDAHAQLQEAKHLFSQLPSSVRRLMDNNPQNMEAVLKDENNKELLIKTGVLQVKKKHVSASSSQTTTKEAADSKESSEK